MSLKHLLLFLLVVHAGYSDVLFGRRVYSSKDRTYHQLWTLDVKTKKTASLTSTPRRHMQPVCAPDGSAVWFLSGVFGEERHTELWVWRRGTRTEELAVRFKGVIVRLLGGTPTRAFFTAIDEADKPALYRWDGKLTRLSPLASALSEAAALSPDGQSIAAQTADGATVTMMSTSGITGRIIDRCSSPVWFADGKKLACTAGAAVRVVDLATGIERATIPFEQRSTPPAVADVSPSGAQLLVKTVGASHSSTSPQSDYWVVSIADSRWFYVGPGQSAVFAPGGGVLLVTPRDLSAVGKGKDWVANLLLVEPATRSQTPLGPAVANHADPCRCGGK